MDCTCTVGQRRWTLVILFEYFFHQLYLQCIWFLLKAFLLLFVKFTYIYVIKLCVATNNFLHVQLRVVIKLQVRDTVVWKFLVEKWFVFEKFVSKCFVVAASPQKFFNNEIIFNSPFFAYGRGTTSDEHRVRAEIRTARTTNKRIIKGELLLQLPCLFVHLGIRKMESKSMLCIRESRN